MTESSENNKPDTAGNARAGSKRSPETAHAPRATNAEAKASATAALPSRNNTGSAALHWLRSLKYRRKELFWAWIAYQTIKGILTTSLIWVPLIFWWVEKN